MSRSNKTETGDEHDAQALYDADSAFDAALRSTLAHGLDADDIELDAAAGELSRLALQSGDDLKLCVLFGQYDFFLKSGRSPPRSMLLAINDAFSKFRAGGKSMDQAFGLGRDVRGNHSHWIQRQWALRQAAMVRRELEDGSALDPAVEKVAYYFDEVASNPRVIDPPASSESTVKRSRQRGRQFLPA